MLREMIPVTNVAVYHLKDKFRITKGETIIKIDDLGSNMVRFMKIFSQSGAYPGELKNLTAAKALLKSFSRMSSLRPCSQKSKNYLKFTRTYSLTSSFQNQQKMK